MLLRPEWDRTCEDCRRYEFDDADGSPARGRVELTIAGDPMPRDGSPPCWRCPKVPEAVKAVRQRTGAKVTPADAVEPTDDHRLAVQHFVESWTVGDFPRDDWVRRNALLVGPVHKQAQDAPVMELIATFTLLLRKLKHA